MKHIMKTLFFIPIFMFQLISCYTPNQDYEIISNFQDYEIINQDEIRLEKIDLTKTFDNPWAIEILDSDDLLVSEKYGKITFVNHITKEHHLVSHNIPSLKVGQGGLLDLLLHENYLYVSFTKDNGYGDYTTAIGRGEFTFPYRKVNNFKIIFEAIPYLSDTKHFGSILVIKDDHLYASIGERGQGIIAQELDSHPGSIIRINLDGSDVDNPNNVSTILPELFMVGVRNPQGMTISPNGRIFISNHGAKGGDFIGEVIGGENYGWNKIGWGGTNYTGTKIGDGDSFSDEFMHPIISWVPSIAPGDIIFYSGDEFLGWDQNLIVTSLKYKLLVKLEMHKGNIVNKQIIFKDKIGRLRDIEVNSSGEIYLITDEKKSSIWRLTSAQNNR